MMDNLYRSGSASDSPKVTKMTPNTGVSSSMSVETAMEWAHSVGQRFGIARHWIETQAIEKQPLATLGVVFGLGVFAGWLVKRR